MEKKQVLCKDCRHYQHITTLQECTRKVVHSPIDGSQTWPLAVDERSPMFGTCGPDGLHWSSLSSLSKSVETNRYWPEYRSLLRSSISLELTNPGHDVAYLLWDALEHVFSKCSPEVQKQLIEEEKKNG